MDARVRHEQQDAWMKNGWRIEVQTFQWDSDDDDEEEDDDHDDDGDGDGDDDDDTERMNSRMDRWMDGWVDGWIDGWMDGCMDLNGLTNVSDDYDYLMGVWMIWFDFFDEYDEWMDERIDWIGMKGLDLRWWLGWFGWDWFGWNEMVLNRIEQFFGIGFSGFGWDPGWINGMGCWGWMVGDLGLDEKFGDIWRIWGEGFGIGIGC